MSVTLAATAYPDTPIHIVSDLPNDQATLVADSETTAIAIDACKGDTWSIEAIRCYSAPPSDDVLGCQATLLGAQLEDLRDRIDDALLEHRHVVVSHGEARRWPRSTTPTGVAACDELLAALGAYVDCDAISDARRDRAVRRWRRESRTAASCDDRREDLEAELRDAGCPR